VIILLVLLSKFSCAFGLVLVSIAARFNCSVVACWLGTCVNRSVVQLQCCLVLAWYLCQLQRGSIAALLRVVSISARFNWSVVTCWLGTCVNCSVVQLQCCRVLAWYLCQLQHGSVAVLSRVGWYLCQLQRGSIAALSCVGWYLCQLQRGSIAALSCVGWYLCQLQRGSIAVLLRVGLVLVSIAAWLFCRESFL